MSKLTTVVDATFGGVNKTADFFGRLTVGFLAILLLSMLVGVFMRYVLRSPTVWSLEVSQICQLLIAALGAAWVLKHEGHIGVDLVVHRIGTKLRSWIHCISSLLICVPYCGFVAWTCWDAAQASKAIGDVSETSYQLPLYPLRLALFLGFCLLLTAFIVRSYKYYHQARRGNSGG